VRSWLAENYHDASAQDTVQETVGILAKQPQLRVASNPSITTSLLANVGDATKDPMMSSTQDALADPTGVPVHSLADEPARQEETPKMSRMQQAAQAQARTSKLPLEWMKLAAQSPEPLEGVMGHPTDYIAALTLPTTADTVAKCTVAKHMKTLVSASIGHLEQTGHIGEVRKETTAELSDGFGSVVDDPDDVSPARRPLASPTGGMLVSQDSSGDTGQCPPQTQRAASTLSGVVATVQQAHPHTTATRSAILECNSLTDVHTREQRTRPATLLPLSPALPRCMAPDTAHTGEWLSSVGKSLGWNIRLLDELLRQDLAGLLVPTSARPIHAFPAAAADTQQAWTNPIALKSFVEQCAAQAAMAGMHTREDTSSAASIMPCMCNSSLCDDPPATEHPQGDLLRMSLELLTRSAGVPLGTMSESRCAIAPMSSSPPGTEGCAHRAGIRSPTTFGRSPLRTRRSRSPGSGECHAAHQNQGASAAFAMPAKTPGKGASSSGKGLQIAGPVCSSSMRAGGVPVLQDCRAGSLHGALEKARARRGGKDRSDILHVLSARRNLSSHRSSLPMYITSTWCEQYAYAQGAWGCELVGPGA
jgi:hypothetical protein